MRERDRERGPSPMRTIRENRGGSGGAQIVLISHGHYFFRVCMVVQMVLLSLGGYVVMYGANGRGEGRYAVASLKPQRDLALRAGGKTLFMPSIGLGTWLSKPGEVRNSVLEGLKAGVRHIDCAWIYGNENEVGSAIAQAFREGIVRREDVFITSKLWNTFHDPAVVEQGIRESLSRLGLAYLDLYLMHWPVALINGTMEHAPHTIGQTWEAMEKLPAKGLTRAIGVSNFGITKIIQLLQTAKIKPAVNQIEAHPYLPQWELIERCRSLGIVVTAYSPLGSPGRDTKSEAEPYLLGDAAIVRAAEENSCTPAQALIRWALMRGTAVIPKSVNPKRIRENLDAANGTLTAKSWVTINDLSLDGRAYRYITGEKFLKKGGVGIAPETLSQFWGGETQTM